MKAISILVLLVSLASAHRYQALKKPIPTKYCIIKNCHNCARSFNYNFGTRESRAVCTAMYHQPGCCDFYIKRSKGILFWIFKIKTLQIFQSHFRVFYLNFQIKNSQKYRVWIFNDRATWTKYLKIPTKVRFRGYSNAADHRWC